MYHINSQFEEIADLSHIEWTKDSIYNEPMLEMCSFDYAYTIGGSVTKSVIDELRKLGIDESRTHISCNVHRLFVGVYPTLPGWHSDTILMNTTYHDPSESKADYKLLWLGDPVAPTEYAVGEADLPSDHDGIDYWRHVNALVEDEITKGNLTTHMSEGGILYQLDGQTLHRCTEANAFGSRILYFIRTFDDQHPVEFKNSTLPRPLYYVRLDYEL